MTLTIILIVIAIFVLIQVAQILGYIKITRRGVFYYLTTVGAGLYIYWLYLILTKV